MFKRISCTEANQLIIDQQAQVIDIRDEQSFLVGHIPGATAINQQNLQMYTDSADLNKPLLVCCYHGNSSQPAADFFNNEKGFVDVYSIDGGFEAWKLDFPSET